MRKSRCVSRIRPPTLVRSQLDPSFVQGMAMVSSTLAEDVVELIGRGHRMHIDDSRFADHQLEAASTTASQSDWGATPSGRGPRSARSAPLSRPSRGSHRAPLRCRLRRRPRSRHARRRGGVSRFNSLTSPKVSGRIPATWPAERIRGRNLSPSRKGSPELRCRFSSAGFPGLRGYIPGPSKERIVDGDGITPYLGRSSQLAIHRSIASRNHGDRTCGIRLADGPPSSCISMQSWNVRHGTRAISSISEETSDSCRGW